MKHFTLHLKNSILLCCFAFGLNMHGQLIVNSAVTGTQLANEIVGAGVTISNVNLQTAANGCGIFSNGGTTNIGLGNGILLTTGLASEAIGPNNVENKTSNVSNFTDDPDLDNITPYSIEDQAILSFDFVAESDFINVQYTFASEEYNEWVCSQFNDLFAFFVSGPNPGGGNYSSQNVALIPSTTLPVSINTINNGTIGSSGNAGSCVSLDHEDLYVDNAGGTTIQYDGFTIVLTSQIAIVPGATYTFKFAIADISDGAYDSGVFIKANSFSIYTCDAGILSHDGAVPNLCSNDAGADNIYVITNSVTPGDTYKFILTNPAGVILAINDTGIFNLASFGVGAFLVYGISYDGTITGLTVGNNISVIGAEAEEGCFDLSPPMTFLRQPCCDLVVEAGPDQSICGNVNLTLTAAVSGAEVCEQEGYSDCTHAVIATTGFAENSSAAGICNDNAGVKLFTLDDTPNNVSTITLDFGTLLPIGTEVCVRVKKEHCNNTPSGTTQSDAKVQVSPTNAADYVTLVNSLLFSHTVYQSYCYTLTAPARYVKITDNAKCAFRVDYVNITTPNVSSSDLQYVWVGPGIVGLSNGPSVLVNQPGTYTVTVTDCGDCTSGDEVVITNDNTPPVFGDQQHDYNVDCTDEIPYIQPTAADNNGNVTYSYLDDTDCPLTEEECDYLTYTQGGWGAPANGNNPGVYRNANFAGAFPSGLVLGCEPGNTLTLTSAAAVENFLPSGSTPAVLGADYLNPGGSYNNVLAGQLMAATLSTTFDAYDANFAPAAGWLGNQVIGSGTFAGMTIAQLLDVANDVIGGCSNAYTPAQLNVALTALNENFDNGGNQGYILCGEIAPNCDCTVTRVWTAEDDCGNEATFTQTFHFGDDEFPVFTYCPAGVDLGCNPTGLPSAYNAIATDNCGTPTITTYWDPEVVVGCVHYRNLIYVATDACDNNATCSQTFSWKVDTTDPTVESCPANATYKCFADVPGPADVKFDDNCDGELIPTYTQTSTNGSSSCNNIITRTWTAVDACGNDASCVQIIYVHDDILPSFTYCPVGANLGCNPTAFPGPGNAIATDNCGAVGVTSALGPITEDGCDRSQTRTYTACDGCNNLAFCYQIFTWKVDTTDPLIESCPDNASYICFSDVPSPADVNFFDNCDGELIPTYTQTSTNGSSSCNNIITRTWTAEDGCGNDASCVQIIYINDDINPTAIYDGQLEFWVECNEELPEIEVTFDDNCDETLETLSYEEVENENGDCSYDVVRTYYTYDDCNNYGFINITFHVADNTDPFIVSSSDPEIWVECGVEVTPSQVIFDDYCDDDLYVDYFTYNDNYTDCGYDVIEIYTAYDDCGNYKVFTRVAHIQDTQAPYIVSSPEPVIYVSCEDDVPALVVEFADACDNDLEQFPISGISPYGCSFVIYRSVTAVDDCGYEITFSQTVYIIDEVAPIIVCPDDAFVGCNQLIPEPDTDDVYAYDTCGDVVVTWEGDVVGDSVCVNRYIIERTYKATDACGNSATCVQFIGVFDSDGPSLSELPEPVISCSYEGDPILPLFTDACGGQYEVTYYDEPQGGQSNDCTQAIVRYWVATDDCGNETIVPQAMFITDNYDPIVIAELNDTTVECIGDLPTEVPTFDDDCDVSLTIDADTSYIELQGCAYIVRIVWTATDECGNSASADRDITIQDTTAPYIVENSAEELWIDCDEDQPAAVIVFDDNCDDELELFGISGLNNVTDCSYDIEQTYFATDNCGNQASWSRVIHVSDMNEPYIVSAPEEFTTLECGDVYPEADVIFADTCDTDLETYYNWYVGENNDCYYDIVEEWWAYDNCQNMAYFTRTVRFIDTTDPIIYCPDSYTVSCASEVDEPSIDDVSAYDVCSGFNVIVAWVEDVITDSTCVNRYTVERKFSATDVCGNVGYCIQYIYVYDNIAPDFTYVPESSANCNEIIDFGMAEAVDNCDEPVVITFEDEEVTDNGGEGCFSEVTRTWYATDACGNQSSAVQVVIVSDQYDPYVIYEPADYEVQCFDEVYADTATFGDNCDLNLTVLPLSSISEDNCILYIHRTWTATDDCGNSITVDQDIIVHDTIAPYVLDTPEEEIWVQCFSDVPVFDPAFGDNCDDDLTYSAISAIALNGCEQLISRSKIATDDCGNTASIGQLVHVLDTTDPTVEDNLEDFEVECDAVIPVAVAPVFDDNCDEDLTIEYDSTITYLDCGYTITRVWTAYDDCENSVSANQLVTIVDNEAPTLYPFQPFYVVECDDLWEFPAVSGYDNCSDVTVTYDQDTLSGGCFGYYIRYYHVSDDCGNTTDAEVIIQVIDTTDPTIENPADEVVSCENAPTEIPDVNYYDNCDYPVELLVATQTIVELEGCSYQIVWHWEVEDYCGNIGEATTTITVVDWTAPILVNVPESAIYECDEIWSVIPPTADDLCNAAWVVTEIDTIEGACPSENTYVYTFYAMDECGNMSEPQFTTIYITDETDPWFNGDLVNESYQCLDWQTYSPQVITASDNCGTASVESYYLTSSSDNCGNGVWTVNYIATDLCGRTSFDSYTITVNDTTDPILENCPEDIEIECDDEIPAPAVLTAYDNCDDDVDVNLVETFEGVLIPVPGATATCRILTPVRPANNPCRYTTNWAMGLFGLPLAHRFYTVHNGAFVQYPNGTVTVTATFKSTTNQNNGWTATVSFNNAMDWAAWSTQTFPTNFKADCGGVAANHYDWTYYRLLNTPGAELIGFGAYTGSSLSLVHAPSNNYFGFQLGNGANSYNSTYGFGGWFSYSGTFKINNVPYGNSTGSISGAGDFAFELDCCLDYEITRTWTATDCSGNTSSCVQTITVGDGPLLAPEAPAGTTLSEIASLRVNPNPTSGTTWFTFTTRESAKTTLELFDMAGKKVADLFAGELEAGTQYSVDYNAELLSTGIYLYRLTNGNSLEQGKLIVNK